MGDRTPLRLFPVPAGDLDEPGSSPDRRRTVRALVAISNGKHPATGRCLLRVGDQTQARVCCGDCDHAVAVMPGNRVVWKCGRDPRGRTRSAATDIRISWPACVLFDRADVPAQGIQRGRYPVGS